MRAHTEGNSDAGVAVGRAAATVSGPAGAAALRTRGVRVRFGAGATLALPDIELEAGGRVLLAGPSGSGKSTLLHVSAGLIDPAQGVVEVDGVDIHRLRGAARDTFRGARIGMIFQTFQLLDGLSALENVLLALMFSPVPPREHDGRARALLDELGIARHGARPGQLSVGQQQRVAVARALACRPRLVLADEPTAALDPARAAAAMDLILGACHRHGAALLCTSHDPAMAHRFERRLDLPDLGEPERGERGRGGA
ncbi:MAG: ABC transporter ATP-binding protein [Planctomyces sp.]|nr:ABC transporter ATP-binding protein [Planctomyces sp.]